MTRILSTGWLYMRAKTSDSHKNWAISSLEFRISILLGDNSRRVLENVIVRRETIIAYHYTRGTNVTLINRYRPRASWRSAPVLFVPEERKRDGVKRLEEARETTCARERDLRILPTRRFARMTRRSARALSLIFLLRDVGAREAHTRSD